MTKPNIATTEEVNQFAKTLKGWKRTSFHDAYTVQSFAHKLLVGEIEPETYETPLKGSVDCLKFAEGQVIWLNTKTGECLRVAW